MSDSAKSKFIKIIYLNMAELKGKLKELKELAEQGLLPAAAYSAAVADLIAGRSAYGKPSQKLNKAARSGKCLGEETAGGGKPPSAPSGDSIA